jgi:putrescine transport system permease protein
VQTTGSNMSGSHTHAPRRRVRFGIPGRYLVVCAPYIWLLIFFLAPFALVLKISFSSAIIAQPPYTDLFDWSTGLIPDIQGTLASYHFLLSDRLYTAAYLNSIKIALVSTTLCLLVGYPMAYGIARAPGAWRNALLMLVILPFWTSFLIRVYAWIGILRTNGVLNNMLMWLGLIDQPLPLLHNDFSVYVGIVYSYLPFMILPLYANLARMDESLLEAASDLGCRPWKAFVSITLPLSLPGIIAGSMLVFIPAVGEFVIPELLGGPDTLMIGKVLWNEFFRNRDWPVASAVAIAMLLFLVIPIVIFQHFQAREDRTQ